MEKDDIKREQILDAAMHCLARYGIIKATMDDIASTLGMKKASLYYYYKNKEAIFIDALEREVLRIQEKVQSKFEEKMSVSEKMLLYVRSIMQYFRGRAEMLELNVQSMLDNHLLIQNLHQRLREKNIDFMAGLISEGITNGEFRRDDPRKLADYVRTILDARRLEVCRNLQSSFINKFDFKKLEEESIYILDLVLNGLKTR